jgi:hypothetical protein
VLPDGPRWAIAVQILEVDDGELLLDLRRLRRRPSGEMTATRRGLAVDLAHAPVLVDAIAEALAAADAMGPR